MEGAQASNDHYEKTLSYLKVGKEEGAKTLTGDNNYHLDGCLLYTSPSPRD